MRKECKDCKGFFKARDEDDTCQHCLRVEWTGGKLDKALQQLAARRDEEKKKT